MADFTPALKRTLVHEGEYARDPRDRGGETYRGIARRRHPGWEGWARIDKPKKVKGFQKTSWHMSEFRPAL